MVDTAPMGHAIRLFQVPEHFARFLDVLETAAPRDVGLAQHFGGRVQREPALDRWTRIVADVERALSAEEAKLVLVTTPEPFSLNEAARSATSFQTGGAQNRIAEIVLNRTVDEPDSCPRCMSRAAQAGAAPNRAATRDGKSEHMANNLCRSCFASAHLSVPAHG